MKFCVVRAKMDRRRSYRLSDVCKCPRDVTHRVHVQGTSAANLDRLQRVQDVLARVVAQAPWSVSSTDIRRDFHWLPIRQRIVYKQCLMTYILDNQIISTS